MPTFTSFTVSCGPDWSLCPWTSCLTTWGLAVNTFCLTYKGSTVRDTISGSIASLKTFNVKTLAKAKYSALNIIVHIADDLTLYPFFTLQNKKPRCYKNQCQVQRCMSNLTLPITIFYIQPWEKILTVTKREPAFLQCHSNPNTVIYILAGRTWCSNLVPIWKKCN